MIGKGRINWTPPTDVSRVNLQKTNEGCLGFFSTEAADVVIPAAHTYNTDPTPPHPNNSDQTRNPVAETNGKSTGASK